MEINDFIDEFSKKLNQIPENQVILISEDIREENKGYEGILKILKITKSNYNGRNGGFPNYFKVDFSIENEQLVYNISIRTRQNTIELHYDRGPGGRGVQRMKPQDITLETETFKNPRDKWISIYHQWNNNITNQIEQLGSYTDKLVTSFNSNTFNNEIDNKILFKIIHDLCYVRILNQYINQGIKK